MRNLSFVLFLVKEGCVSCFLGCPNISKVSAKAGSRLVLKRPKSQQVRFNGIAFGKEGTSIGGACVRSLCLCLYFYRYRVIVLAWLAHLNG
jgi:hypothetical protein